MVVPCTALVNKLKGKCFNCTIHGITVLDAELYVLRSRRKSNDIAVFDLSAYKYALTTIRMNYAGCGKKVIPCRIFQIFKVRSCCCGNEKMLQSITQA